MKPTVDSLVMLLSVDWAFEHWVKLGLCSSKSTKLLIQSQCRILVSSLLDGASDYWQISFDEKRINDTVSEFFSSVQQCGVSQQDINIFQKIVGSGDAVDIRKTEDEMLATLTEILFSLPETASGVPSRTVERIRNFINGIPLNQSEIVTLCLNSGSEWDTWTRQVMPDMPVWLADFFIDIYPSADRFRQFWAQVTEDVSDVERTLLASWYGKASLELLGHEIVP